jgi:tetratricopeptide (TPR) repeat protein
MSRRTTSFLAIVLCVAVQHLLEARAQKPAAPDAPEAADEARERKVMERFLGVLEKTPRRGTALDRVYGYHVERGSLDAFLKTYQSRVAADPNDGASWLLIGLVEAQRGRDSAAVEAFRKAESTRPDDALPSYYLGQALVLVGQPDSAAEAFERALTRKPGRADLLDVYQALGRVHQRAHRNDKALAVWDRLEKAFPDDPRVQEQIAHALADEGQDASALARFEALAKSTRDRFRQVQFAMEAAELKVRLGKSPEALADFETLLGKLDPESWLYREVRRKVEEVFLRTDDLAGLATYYEKWIKKTPDDVEAMARLGRTLASQGRVSEARKWLDEAVKLAPSRRELRLALIEQLVQDRKFAEAASQYEALAKLEPNNPDVVRDWGRMLLRDVSKPEAERKNAAASVWRRLAPDDAKDAVAVAQAADLFRQANLSDEAIALYQRAIKLAPESTQYREYLGEYYHALKRPNDALATWRASVEGPARNARTLGRLGEVLTGFGYRKEAVEPLTEACRLEPDDFDLRLKLADLKLAMDQPIEALTELEKAEKSASAEEQTEAVLDRLIRAYQASGTLASRIEGLQKSLAATPSAAGWTRLARLLEADQKSPEAARAIGEATKLDPKSIPAWVATARLREAAGDILGSAEALRTLTNLDRRSRTDYLTGIAKLEARLGRRGPALEAGRELLAAAPGNPDHHQFFAELCFQLGEPDEGLDALRRAARANPSDPKAMLTLAENLARQFRPEEAIELFWRAFAKTPEVDGKLSIVSRMADQYLQRNQLDRLLGRLERELREPNQQRELSLSLAQAHAASGDYATARLELERLLASNARDTQLLTQLSNLAEQEGDLATAAKYQKQALDLAPSPEASGRLAQLYLRSGDYLDAEALWTRNTEGDQDPGRALSAIDSLLTNGKREAVLTITGRMLRTRPDDWELLYREGVALAGLDRLPDAEARFRAILALKLGDDEKGLLARSKGASGSNPAARAPGTPVAPAASARLPTLPIQERSASAFRARTAAGLDGNMNQVAVTHPLDFGQARVYALAWRLALAQRQNKQDEFVKEQRTNRDKAPGDPRLAWDWYYLQLVRQEYPEIFEAAKSVAKLLPTDSAAQVVYLSSLANRTLALNQPRAFRQPGSTIPDSIPALPGEEVDRVFAFYQAYQKRRPDLAPALLSEVLAELKRANRSQDADKVYHDTIVSMVPGSPYASALFNSALERGDTEGILAYLDKLERVPATGAAATSNGSTIAQAYSRMIGFRGVTKTYPEVLALLDRFLAFNTRSRLLATSGARSAAPRAIANRNNAIAYWITGLLTRGVGIDFPSPNERFDAAALGVVRSAFEVYHRDDLLSDLFAHLQARVDKASGPEQADLLLAMGFCQWWSEDKDDAEDSIRRASEAAGADPLVRMILAELLERKGSLTEALAAVDSIDAIDSGIVQKRENLALRLAVALGNVDRARQAAERLFGLRLDAEAQVQLAALMSQLGMHDLAEAVLARARRSAGNKPPSLLILMTQYQRQKKADQELQVALQILRLRPVSLSNVAANPNAAMAGGNPAAEDDYARREAIQVLSRSGKINDLVARAEAQLERSPNSMQVLQTLAEYARIANDKDKARKLYDRMVKARPDDARLRLQLAAQFLQLGDNASAVDYYRAAIKSDPSALTNQFFPIMNAFRQADKFEEFAALIDRIDLRTLGNSNMIMNIAQNLMNDPKVKDQGLAMFRKIWAAFPAERAMYINLLNSNEEWWRLPEVYSYTRDLVIPSKNAATVTAWWGVETPQFWGNNGQVFTMAKRLLDSATMQNKLGELEAEVRQRIGLYPGWSGGKVMLALIMLRDGRFDDARATVKGLMLDVKEPMPGSVRGLIAQELEERSPVQDLAEEIYESGMRDFLAKGNFDPNDNNNLTGKILGRYHASGRIAEARELLLKLASVRPTSTMYDSSYLELVRLSYLGNYAHQLAGLGFPADGVQLLREQIAATEASAKDPQFTQYVQPENFIQQAQQGIQQILGNAKPDALASAVASLFRPGPGPSKPGEPLDLYLSTSQFGLEKDSIASGMVEIVRKISATGNTPPEVGAGLSSLLMRSPDDFGANVTACLLAFAEGKPDSIEAATTRLLGLVDRVPLETLVMIRTRSGTNPRPNARQRTEATRQLGLWLVARECWKTAGMKARGDRFASRALEAARRQEDSRYVSCMLREWGQVNLDLSDREQAETRWSELLDALLARPEPKKAKPIAEASATSLATPRENFDKAMILARMAAERSMNKLSIKAVREAFRGGSPVGLQLGLDASNVTIGGPAQQMGIAYTRQLQLNLRNRRGGNNDEGSGEAPTGPIVARLGELEALWVREGVAAREVFEVLRDVVLPTGRPMQVDLYPLGLGIATANHPRSVGDRLANWAVRAGAADELREAARARRGNPVSKLSAIVLEAQLELALGRPEKVADALDRLENRLRQDSLRVSAELAAHAALPALKLDAAEKSAIALLDRAIKNLSAQTGTEPLCILMQSLAGHHLDRGRLDQGRKLLMDSLDLQDRSLAQNQANLEFVSYYRRGNLLRVAAAFARRGIVVDALEVLGRYADLAPTRFLELSPSGTVAALARGLVGIPSEHRYRLLKGWTVPTPERKTVRSLVAFFADSDLPSSIPSGSYPIKPGGVFATPLLLIEAAREARMLDELASEVRVLDDKSVEEARPLLVLVEIARGKGSDVIPKIEAMAAELEKAVKQSASSANVPQNGVLPTPPLVWFLVARESLLDDRLNAVGERLANGLIERPWNGKFNGATTQSWMLAHLRRDLLQAKAARASGRSQPIDRDGGLASWTPTEAGSANPFLSPVRTAWFEHGGYIGSQGPNQTDTASLSFAFPLAGSFEFSVESEASTADGSASVSFGGQSFADRSPNGVQNGMRLWVNPQMPGFGLDRADRSEGFNRITLRFEPGKAHVLVNGIVVDENSDLDPTSPWISLTGRGEAFWRAFELTGKPEVPREVRISQGDRLGGWSGSAYTETLAPGVPDRSGGVDLPNLEVYDWFSRDDEIRGRRIDETAGQINVQSRLAYARPMLDGESVSYSFLHEPGRVEVYPALGRLAFLIEKEGVRLHWMTETSGLDPSGLAADNAVEDPASRRGSKPIPLKPNAWNLARLSLARGTVQLELNGELVFERAVGANDDRTFSLFHFKDRTASRVRDVVLRGDWPEKFEAARLAGLTARSRPSRDDADRRASHAMIGEQVLTQDAEAILRRTRALEPSNRFEALAAWVLPGPDHPTIRLQGQFTPLDPAPGEGSSAAKRRRVQVGGEPESPAADLVEVARASGRLQELLGRVDSARTGSATDERGKIALLAMIRLAQGSDDESIAAFSRLKGLAGTIKVTDPDWMRWPELMAAWSAVGRPKVRSSALSVLDVPKPKTDETPGPSELMVRQIRQVRAIGDAQERGRTFADGSDLGPWVPIFSPRASLRGRGFPRSSWTSIDGVVTNQSGRGEDALLLGVPLRGDFSASGELSASAGREASLGYAGISVRLKPDGKALLVEEHGQDANEVVLSPPLEIKADWAAWKVSVKEGHLAFSVGGRVVLERTIPPDVDPWLTIGAPGPLGASARNLAITGKPIVPDRIKLSNLLDLAGWSTTEYDENAPANQPAWRKRGDEIVGRLAAESDPNMMNNRLRNRGGFADDLWDGQGPNRSKAGSKQESVIRYRRPLVENATIEYEFYSEPGKAMVNPALGRLAFLLSPDGVAVHRMTDGPYERAGLDPGNASVESENRRGPASLPLNPKAWNRLKLGLAGDVVTITLNEVLIYERPIEPTNSRTFGLFHYANETEARVRNPTYRGDWPRTPPALIAPK